MDLDNINRELKPYYEASRKAKNLRLKLIGGGFVMVILNFFINSKRAMNPYYGGFSGFFSSFFMAFVLIIIIVILDKFMVQPKIKAYITEVKTRVFPQIFAQYFENIVYDPQRGYDRETMRYDDIIDLGTDYETEDYLQGTYKGVSFSRSDIYTSTTITTSGANGTTTTTTTVYFQGQVYRFDFNKAVEAYIRTRQRGGFFSRSFAKGPKTHGASNIDFEDQDFNKQFYTLSTDEHWAYYVFTPQFMNRLKSLANQAPGDIGIVIKGSTMYLACYSRLNSFEIKPGQIIDAELVSNIEAQIKIIQTVVDTLGLDSDLFKERSFTQ